MRIGNHVYYSCLSKGDAGEKCHKRISQGKLLLATCYQERSFGVAGGDRRSLTRYNSVTLHIMRVWYNVYYSCLPSRRRGLDSRHPHQYAPVAQWIRAMGFYPTGRGFESLPGYQLKHRVCARFFNWVGKKSNCFDFVGFEQAERCRANERDREPGPKAKSKAF